MAHSMNKRDGKIMRMNKSLGVILPKDWTRGNELEAGDVVEITYDEIVRIQPKENPRPRK